MRTLDREILPVREEGDIVAARRLAKGRAVRLGLGLVAQTKLVTAVSELARNMLEYGGGGLMTIEELADGGRRGVRARFEDQGPGIPDLALAMRDGYTSGKGLGQGLPGARRLVHEFEIESRPNQGTRVVITQWK